jgi:hypothetical protein
VDSTALARTYIVPVTISYEDDRGLFDTLSIRDNVNIPVTQQARLNITSMTLPHTANVGMPTPVMAEFVNSGRVDLTDFTVWLEGDFEVVDARLYMARFGIGSMNSYTGILIASEEGEREGTLFISYMDNNNQEVVDEYPFTVIVEPGFDMGVDRPWPGEFPPDMGMPADEGNSVLRLLRVNWVPALLIAAVIFQMIYIIRLKRKAKEEFFDE